MGEQRSAHGVSRLLWDNKCVWVKSEPGATECYYSCSKSNLSLLCLWYMPDMPPEDPFEHLRRTTPESSAMLQRAYSDAISRRLLMLGLLVSPRHQFDVEQGQQPRGLQLVNAHTTYHSELHPGANTNLNVIRHTTYLPLKDPKEGWVTNTTIERVLGPAAAILSMTTMVDAHMPLGNEYQFWVTRYDQILYHSSAHIPGATLTMARHGKLNLQDYIQLAADEPTPTVQCSPYLGGQAVENGDVSPESTLIHLSQILGRSILHRNSIG